MNNIIIKKINNKSGEYLVFSTTVESPFFALEKITKAIKDEKAIIIFDQLLQVGNSKDRFIAFNFDKELNFNTAKIINDAKTDLLKIEISKYLNKHPEYIKYSILLNSQKNKILEGGIL